MKNLLFMVSIILVSFLAVGFDTINPKNDKASDEIAENTITINGNTYNLIIDPCVDQDSDEVKMLTFRGDNSDMGYSLTVVIASYDNVVNSGKYVYSNGENKVNFSVVALVTEEATYVANEGFVTYTKTNNAGNVVCKDLKFVDSFETLPSILVSFNITCVL